MAPAAPPTSRVQEEASRLRLSINGQDSDVVSPAELQRSLIPFANERFREIWLSVEAGPALCAQLNGNVGWLMYLRTSDGDAGFSSRNPAFQGSPAATVEYRLSNGQRDEYPASWAFGEEEVLRALDYFVEHRSRAPFIHWHDDSAA